MDLALNNPQELMCCKTQPTIMPQAPPKYSEYILIFRSFSFKFRLASLFNGISRVI